MLRAGPGHLCVVSVRCLYTTTSLWRASSTTLTETAHWTAQCVGVCRVHVCISFEACRLEQLDQGRECTHNHLACIYCCEAEDQ